MSDAALWASGLGVLGAVFGSFIATVAIRWPEGRSALSGRSMCDGCGRTLRAPELVPIVGFVALHGSCSRCGSRIALIHPVCELTAAAMGVVAGLIAPGWSGVAGALFGWQLLLLTALDMRALWLPNVLTAVLAVSGLLIGPASLTDRAIGGTAGYAALWIVAIVYARLRGRLGLGGGDPKLFGAIGLWLGWRALPTVLLIACVVGLGWALLRRLDRDARLPLGALLAVGAFVMWVASYL